MTNKNTAFGNSKNIPEQESTANVHVEIAQQSRLVRTALKRARRKYDKQIRDLTEAKASTKYQQQADSILANIGAVPPWKDSCLLLNVHTNTNEIVHLNAKLSAKENANAFYRKARKGLRGSAIIETRLSETGALVCVLEALENDLLSFGTGTFSDQETGDMLEKVRLCLAEHGIGGAEKKHAASVKAIDLKQVPYRHFTLEGWDIFIGRNNAQNDELVTRFAKPSDIWMHVAVHAGSHVIIRRNKNREWPPAKILECAASFAVWFSRMKHTSFAEVHVTEKRYVSKRRSSPPGKVAVSQFKTISVSPFSPQEFFKTHPGFR